MSAMVEEYQTTVVASEVVAECCVAAEVSGLVAQWAQVAVS